MLFFLPLLPLVGRSLLWFWYRETLRKPLPPDIADDESHRAASLAIAGFALTILMGLAVVEHLSESELELPIFYSGCSFLGYLVVYNVQGYKYIYFLDQLGDAAMDIGSLCLILALASVLVIVGESKYWKLLILGAACLVWLMDHGMRLRAARDLLRHS